jgi:outer membrane protein assembly factor BamB
MSIRKPSRSSFAVFACAALICLTGPFQTCHGQDWPQWRGPTRDGVVSVEQAPASWPASFRTMWRLEIGEGHASPVLSKDRVFVHSRRDPNEVVTAVALNDGKVLWQCDYKAPFEKNQYARRFAKGPYATPLLAGDRLFTLGASAILKAWDTATGRELWSRDFSKQVVTTNMFCGTAASPLLVDQRVVVQVGSDVHGGQVLALNPADGVEHWKWTGPGPGYASPALIEVGGNRQIVIVTESSLVGLEATIGRQLWSAPFPDEWHENIVTPLWTGQVLVVSGVRQGTHAFRLRGESGTWAVEEAWSNPGVTMYMSSPVLGDGLIYGHSSRQRGQFVALEAATGKVHWASEGRDGDQASVLLTPDHVVYMNNTGELILGRRRTTSLEIERRYRLTEAETWAVPVLLRDGSVLRDSGHLMRLSF